LWKAVISISPSRRAQVPFAYRGKDGFTAELSQWIGEVFYDVLPTHGYEIREEQIYTAFQLADAVCKEKVHFAEAGLGTGKTFAYLLTAVAYSRYKGKPAVIACASTALQEQLAGSGGDIEKLSNLLGLDIDARMAKDPRQYICDKKVNRLNNALWGQPSKAVSDIIEHTGQAGRGERSELPQVPDRVWTQVAWDETMSCEACATRGFCKQAKAREYYQAARDLIVCDHGIFFDDLWTREERLADGKLPFLPDYAVVIFDEGHKLMLPAAMRAGRQISEDDINSMLLSLEKIQGARTSLLSAVVATDAATAQFFEVLQQSTLEDERTDRHTVRINGKLLQAADTMRRALEALHFELQNEQELHLQSLSDTRLETFEARVERALMALRRFARQGGQEVIVWVDREDQSFWVVPRDLSGLLNKELFAKGLPVVFSSATLSTAGDFSYLARTIGVSNPSSSIVESSFEYDRQVQVYLPRRFPAGHQQDWFPLALGRLVALLRRWQGRALVLTNAPSEMRRIRKGLQEYRFPFAFLWEDSAERGYLIRKFREDVSSVLVGSGFWEGIDVPGEALSLLVIWRLPWPPRDPLITARRAMVSEQGLNPVTAVDYPEMGLKLKQGCGRLIRTSDDRGAIAVLEPVLDMPWERVALGALPEGAQIVHKLADLKLDGITSKKTVDLWLGYDKIF